jgi:DNA-binding XRE family transcriptional regulator
VLSQERLAKQAGVARESIIALERGGFARAATIQRLAATLKVTPMQLMSAPPEPQT